MAAVMVQGQFINDKQVLLKAADEAGVQGAQHLLDNEEELKSEVRRVLLLICHQMLDFCHHVQSSTDLERYGADFNLCMPDMQVLHEVKTIAQAQGVTGVPFFIINDKYQLSGAQEPDTFAKVFERL